MGKDIGITPSRTTSQTHEDYNEQDQYGRENHRPRPANARFFEQRNRCILYQLNISHWHIGHLNIDGELGASQDLSLKKDSQQQQ
jgi:hypothetical protein